MIRDLLLSVPFAFFCLSDARYEMKDTDNMDGIWYAIETKPNCGHVRVHRLEFHHNRKNVLEIWVLIDIFQEDLG